MSKKIEPGCRAVIVNSLAGNNGIEVTVIKNVGRLEAMRKDFGDRWIVDKNVNSTTGNLINNVGEDQLKRIDDYDGNKKVSWEGLKDIWTPNKLKVTQ